MSRDDKTGGTASGTDFTGGKTHETIRRIDDGWFGKRDSDTSSLGDYSVNPKKLPNGLKGLGEKLNAIEDYPSVRVGIGRISMDNNRLREKSDRSFIISSEMKLA